MTSPVPDAIEAALATLLPPGIAVAAGSVAAIGDGELLGDEARAAATMVPRRRREFAAGRTCARRALQALGLAPGALPVAADRRALWPAGTCGSITHAGAFAAAAAAPLTRLAGLGIDLEACAPLEPELVARLCRPEELASAPQGLAASVWPRVVFSAKESVYKAVSAAVGRFIDFDEVRVTAAPGTAAVAGDAAGALSFAPAGAAADLHVVRRLTGGYAVAGGLIVTVAWLAPAHDAATG
jgi:4'-phosphopantetheinyl transferase EntD